MKNRLRDFWLWLRTVTPRETRWREMFRQALRVLIVPLWAAVHRIGIVCYWLGFWTKEKVEIRYQEADVRQIPLKSVTMKIPQHQGKWNTSPEGGWQWVDDPRCTAKPKTVEA